MDREGLQRLLSDVEDGDIGAVVVYKADRLGPRTSVRSSRGSNHVIERPPMSLVVTKFSWSVSRL